MPDRKTIHQALNDLIKKERALQQHQQPTDPRLNRNRNTNTTTSTTTNTNSNKRVNTTTSTNTRTTNSTNTTPSRPVATTTSTNTKPKTTTKPSTTTTKKTEQKVTSAPKEKVQVPHYDWNIKIPGDEWQPIINDWRYVHPTSIKKQQEIINQEKENEDEVQSVTNTKNTNNIEYELVTNPRNGKAYQRRVRKPGDLNPTFNEVLRERLLHYKVFPEEIGNNIEKYFSDQFINFMAEHGPSGMRQDFENLKSVDVKSRNNRLIQGLDNKLLQPIRDWFTTEEVKQSSLDYNQVDQNNSGEYLDTVPDIPVRSVIPSIIGDTITERRTRDMYNSPEYFFTESDINLNDVVLGYRNRYTKYNSMGVPTELVENTTPVKDTDGIILNSYYPFLRKADGMDVLQESAKYAEASDNLVENNPLKYYFGINKEGKFVHGTDLNAFADDDILTKTFGWEVSDIEDAGHKKGIKIIYPEGNSKILPSYTTSNKKMDNYIKGKLLLVAGDEARLIIGNADSFKRAIKAMKERNNTDRVTMYAVDQGSYAEPMMTYDDTIDEKNWEDHYDKNSGGGHSLYVQGRILNQ